MNASRVAPTSRVVFGRIDSQRSISDGAKAVTRVLRSGSLEVVYTGFHPAPESLVERVVAEQAIAVAISIDSGEHLTVVPRAIDLLQSSGASDLLVVVGGSSAKGDAERLRRCGVAAVFGGTKNSQDMLQFIASWAESRPQ